MHKRLIANLIVAVRLAVPSKPTLKNTNRSIILETTQADENSRESIVNRNNESVTGKSRLPS